MSRPNYSGQDLTGHDFSNKYIGLEFANFSNAILNGANFSNSELSHANFSNAKLNNANFTYSNLVETNFTEAELDGANFTNANLNSAKLSRAIATNTIFTNATLVGTIVNGTNFQGEGTTFENAGVHLDDLNDTQFPDPRQVLNARSIANRVRDYIQEPTEEELLRRYYNEQMYRNRNRPTNEAEIQNQNNVNIALQVHRFSSKINMNEYNNVLKSALKEEYREFNNVMNANQIKDFLFNMIDDSFKPKKDETETENEQKKQKYKKKLNKILNKFKKAKDISEDPNELQVISNSIIYVSKQPLIFKKNYLDSYIEDTYNAYPGALNEENDTNEDRMSCVKGIVERFVTNIGTAIQIVCSDGGFHKCRKDKEYDKLIKALGLKKIDLTELNKKWSEDVLETDEGQNMTRDKLIENYIKFLTDAHKAEGIPEGVYDPIIKDAVSEIDGTKHKGYDVFSLKMFGGKKRHTKKRKYKNKNKSKRRVNK